MSRHEGVSCDSCLKGNFGGRRYKCLVCFDYDLCSACYESGPSHGAAPSTRHSIDHPMQCILTRSDFDLFYGGESVSSDQHQSYTCPHCGRMGFTDLLLLEHVSAEHADVSADVVCPVCAAYPGGEPNHVVDDLAAHLMLEHRTANNDLDVQLSGMRAVRRIPHHGRTASNPRTRRAANLQYQSSPGSTLMVLSPGDRDHEAMDPIAELLSQLSSVRSRSVTAQSISSQLHQLEMQLHTTRLHADHLAAGQPAEAAARSMATISFPPAAEQVASSSVSSSAASAKERSAYLLAKLDDTGKSENEQQATESQRADKSLFVQELLLAAIADRHGCDTEQTPKVDDPPKACSTSTATAQEPAAPTAANNEPVRTAPEKQAPVERTTTVSRSGRAPVTTAPPVDSRTFSNTSVASRNNTKRKPTLPARTSKESASGANTAKRH